MILALNAYHAGVKTDKILACSLILLKSLADAMSLSIPSLHTNCHTRKDNEIAIRTGVPRGANVNYTEGQQKSRATGHKKGTVLHTENVSVTSYEQLQRCT
jgi:hypothetical protein